MIIKKNIKFFYNEEHYWLKRTGEFFVRGRPLGCGFMWYKIDDNDELIEELKRFVEED